MTYNYSLTRGDLFSSEQSKDKAPFVITLKLVVAVIAVAASVATIAALVVAIVIGVQQLRTRYDSSAVAGGGLEMTFRAGNSQATGSFNASAGQLKYSLEQTQGNNAMMYDIAYKKRNVANYANLRTNWVFPANNTPYGSWNIERNTRTEGYDVRVNKKSQTNTQSKMLFVWIVA